MEVLRAGRAPGDPQWLSWDMAASDPTFDEVFEYMIHAAPLWLLADRVSALAQRGVRRIIGYSSTSVETKEHSGSKSERKIADALADAENRIRVESREAGIDTTLFRPTMIYGYGRDGNITTIARFISRYGFFPVAGAASGRRQPIHADDAADAAVKALDRNVSFGRTYYLTGGETLTYRGMVERIFRGLGKRARILSLPAPLYTALLDAAGILGRNVSGAMAGRMNVDLVFDSSETKRDIACSSQKFLENPERDLAWASERL